MHRHADALVHPIDWDTLATPRPRLSVCGLGQAGVMSDAQPYTVQVVVDCADPHALADWWAEALGWQVETAR